MKKIFIITLAAFCVVAFGVGQAMAAGYDVTSSFGVRVTEQGPSEQIGSITINPQTVAADNPFVADQIITVELLGNATISATTVADYTFGDPTPVGSGLATDADKDDVDDWETANGLAITDYRLIAVKGNDFFLIKVGTLAAPVVDSIIVGNMEASRICFNLVGTVYTASDPARQLVQVSYSDQLSNTYSGDTYVATVKAKSVVVENCDKTNKIVYGWSPTQGPDCGITHDDDGICLEITDTATGSFPADTTYKLTIGKKESGKAGVGFGIPTLEDEDNDAATIDDIVRYNRTGSEIEESDYDDIEVTSTLTITAEEQLYADTAYMEFKVTFTAACSGPQTYTLEIPVYYDTCIATTGSWLVDLTSAKVPCGASFIEEDINVAQFDTSVDVTAIFPYAAASEGGWFNGLVITNPNDSAVTVAFTITEADGDVYTGSATVAANQMAVGLAETVMNPTTTGADAAFGDESYTITATAASPFYGFIFIGDGTMAQGYLPIIPTYQLFD